ncbi:diaminopimelate decarboxylase [Candidatus Nitrososphaera evergladensis SR1]|uniref:Diaminopimelate decarboxylase n=1 Tax=Candidatus Nitrososphaera evergladensis SR1 TaxID=1459636 RepID=A0A075MUB6_9ARCH|nr:diaminopimelate decarboxylase [Candidatus Nitrososphaera evergladensis SR1]
MAENTQVQLVPKQTSALLNRFATPLDVKSLVAQYGTPLYLVDEDTLHAKARELQRAYSKFKGPVKVAYSIKANFSPAIVRAFMKDGLTFDLTSLGELHFIKQCNADPENVIYTSVTEEPEEYVEVLKSGVRRIVVSSHKGMMNLALAAGQVGVRPLTMIRVNPEVATDAKVRASYKNGKFGVPFNGGTIDSATKMVKYLMGSDLLKFEGFHFHLGSQITDFSCYTHALDKMDAFMTKMKKEYPNFQVNTFDIGGGTPVFYNDPVPTPAEMAQNHLARLNQLAETHGIFTLMIESGRFLVAESSILVSRIVNTKEYNEHKIVIVDAGYHILLDAALLKQEYPQEVIPVVDSQDRTTALATPKNTHLAGRLCDTYDVFPLSKASDMSGAEVGNYVSFYNVGAYSVVFNMPFHCQTKPPVVMKDSDGKYRLVRKGTTYEQLFVEEGGDIA